MAVLSLNLASILVFFYIARPFNIYRLIAMGIVFIFTVIVVALPVLVPSLERFFFVLRSVDLANVKPIDVLIGVFGVISAQLIYERIR